MKNRTYFLLAIIIIVLLLSAWMYLLFFGTPKNADEVFTDLGLRGSEDPTLVIEPVPEPVTEPVVNLDRPKLRQLTTTAVIGFGEVTREGGGTQQVYYAEAGTGHIFVIDLATGEETRISNTTIPEASAASFSPTGTHVAIRTEGSKQFGPLTVGELSPTSGKLSDTIIAENVADFKIINSTELLYTTPSASGMENRRFDLATGKTTLLFTVPFFEVTMDWGSSSTGIHYAYPKPSFLLEGYGYQFRNGAISRIPIAGFGLTMFANNDFIIYNKTEKFKPKTEIYSIKDGEAKEITPFIALPEKCAESRKTTAYIWCGFESSKTVLEFPDYWYRGIASYQDSIWRIKTDGSSSELLVDTFRVQNRAIDIVYMTIGDSETALYFTNKNDNTLWMYEL